MADAWSRRDALALAGSALTVGLAGCGTAPSDASSPTVSAPPEPTASPTPSVPPTRSPTADPIPDEVPPDAYTFDATVARQFTSAHPARVELTFATTVDWPITIVGGVPPPFSFFWNEPRDDEEFLLTVPDLSGSAFDRHPLGGIDDLPTTPSEGACWAMDEAVVDLLRTAHTVVEPGEMLTQPFGVYDFQYDHPDDLCLATGDYPFRNEAELVPGRRTPNGSQHQERTVTLRFILTIREDGSLAASVPP